MVHPACGASIEHALSSFQNLLPASPALSHAYTTPTRAPHATQPDPQRPTTDYCTYTVEPEAQGFRRQKSRLSTPPAARQLSLVVTLAIPSTQLTCTQPRIHHAHRHPTCDPARPPTTHHRLLQPAANVTILHHERSFGSVLCCAPRSALPQLERAHQCTHL